MTKPITIFDPTTGERPLTQADISALFPGQTLTGDQAIVGNVTATGTIAATGNLSGGNISTPGAATVTGNLSAGNVSTAGALKGGSGNVTGSLAVGVDAAIVGNVTCAKITPANAAAGSHVVNIASTGNLTFVDGILTTIAA